VNIELNIIGAASVGLFFSENKFAESSRDTPPLVEATAAIKLSVPTWQNKPDPWEMVTSALVVYYTQHKANTVLRCGL
jgi:hypothetical protein